MTLAEAQKILEKVAAGKAGGIDPEVVKGAMSLLMKVVMEEYQAKPTLPTPLTPELPCSWRLSDELQKARLIVPEPSRCHSPIVEYLLWPPSPWTYESMSEAERFKPIEKSQFEKKMFCTEDGSRFEAWTADGKNPVFPIPL